MLSLGLWKVHIHYGSRWTRINQAEGHKNALDLDILHRDVSGPNVMIAVKNINSKCAIPSKFYL